MQKQKTREDIEIAAWPLKTMESFLKGKSEVAK